VIAAFAVTMLVAVAPSAASARSTAPPSTPPTSAPLAVRARAAKIPVLKAEAFATHTHTLVEINVDGKPVVIPAEIGIDDAAGRITAVHSHDETGIVHVESPKAGATFGLDQFLTLWGVGGSPKALCRSLTGATGCTVSVSSDKRGAASLTSTMHDRETITVDLTSAG
jgi:hypothetical protein